MCSNEINTPYWGPDISYESSSYGLSSNATYNPNQYGLHENWNEKLVDVV